MEILARRVEALTTTSVELVRRSIVVRCTGRAGSTGKYLALEEHAQRFDVGVKYGLLTAQLALALSGRDREDVLARLVELLSTRELGREPLGGLGSESLTMRSVLIETLSRTMRMYATGRSTLFVPPWTQPTCAQNAML